MRAWYKTKLKQPSCGSITLTHLALSLVAGVHIAPAAEHGSLTVLTCSLCFWTEREFAALRDDANTSSLSFTPVCPKIYSLLSRGDVPQVSCHTVRDVAENFWISLLTNVFSPISLPGTQVEPLVSLRQVVLQKVSRGSICFLFSLFTSRVEQFAVR